MPVVLPAHQRPYADAKQFRKRVLAKPKFDASSTNSGTEACVSNDRLRWIFSFDRWCTSRAA
jgi:hypothetical protein